MNTYELRAKFEKYCDNEIMDKEVNSEFCEQISDDFAVKFGIWLSEYFYSVAENKWVSWSNDKEPKTTTELLKIFKNNHYE